jgi:hypothetical protein
MQLFMCKHCDKPVGCEVTPNNIKFCVDCTSKGVCVVEKAVLCGKVKCKIVSAIAHYSCSRRIEECLNDVLYVAT